MNAKNHPIELSRIPSQAAAQLLQMKDLPMLRKLRMLSRQLKLSPENAAELLRKAGSSVSDKDLREFYEKEKEIHRRKKQRRLKKQTLLKNAELEMDSTQDFALIIDYTSQGFPFGIEWENNMEPDNRTFPETDSIENTEDSLF